MLFGRNWPVWVGGVAYGIINVFLFIQFQPWTTLDGVLNWGNHIFGRFGIGNPDPLPALLRSGSVINFGLIFGAFLAALLAGQFGIRIGPKRELVKGGIGGLLMGTGAVLVRGCNIGGFFSGASSLSFHGLSMAAGLIIGAFLGARYLVWEVEKITASSTKTYLHNPRKQLYVGGIALVLALAAVITYARLGYSSLAVILLFGILLGVVSQRTRICFVRAFRDPFITGDSTHTKAMLLALVISIVGFMLVKFTFFEKVDAFVRPTFWQGSLVGGIIFGVGMVLASGCGGGTMWRAGEGHVKLWLALAGYITAAAFMNDWLITSGLINRLGDQVFLPDVIGWAWTFVLLMGILALWFLLAQWNEMTRRLAALY